MDNEQNINFVQYWQNYISTPVRPSLDDLTTFEKFIQKNIPENKTVLLIGITPELRELCAQYDLRVICTGQSEQEFVQSKQLMDRIGQEEFVLSDWNQLPQNINQKFDLILCDNILNFAGKDESKNILDSISELLSENGKFVIRTAIRQNNEYDTVLENILKRFKSKYPELLPTQSCLYEMLLCRYNYEQDFVELKSIWQEAKNNFDEGFIEEQELFDIEVKNWQNSNQCFYIPLQEDFFSICSDSGLQLLDHQISEDVYSGFNPVFCFEPVITMDFDTKTEKENLEKEIDILEKIETEIKIADEIMEPEVEKESVDTELEKNELKPKLNKESEVAESEAEFESDFESELGIIYQNPYSPTINTHFLEQYEKVVNKVIKGQQDPKILVLGATAEIRDLLLSKGLKITVLAVNQQEFDAEAEKMNIKNSPLETQMTDDLLKMPFIDNTFDLVLGDKITNSYNKNEINQVFSEINRVLKPLGIVLFRNLVRRSEIEQKDIDVIIKDFSENKNWPDLFFGFYLYSNIVSHNEIEQSLLDSTLFFKEIDDLAEKGLLSKQQYKLFTQAKSDIKETIFNFEELQEIIMNEFGNIEVSMQNEPLHLATFPMISAKKQVKEKQEWENIAEFYSNISSPYKLSDQEKNIITDLITNALKDKANPKALVFGVSPEIRNILKLFSDEKGLEITIVEKDRQNFLAMNTFIEQENLLEKYLEQNWQDIDFAEQYFDIVITDLFLCDLSKQEQELLFKKIKNYLTKNANLIIRTKNVSNLEVFENKTTEEVFIELLEKYTKLYQNNEIYLNEAANYLLAEILDYSSFQKNQGKSSLSFVLEQINEFNNKLIDSDQKLILSKMLENFSALAEKTWFVYNESEQEQLFNNYFKINEKLSADDNLLGPKTPIYYLELEQQKQIAEQTVPVSEKKAQADSQEKETQENLLFPTKLELEIHKKNILKHINNVKNPKMLVLGVTPEFRDLGLSLGMDVTAVEMNPQAINDMNEYVTIKDRQKEKVILGNWLDVKLPQDNFDVVIGDFSFNFLEINNYKKLFKKLRTILKESGCLSIKTIVHPDNELEKSFENYLQDYRDKLITFKELYILSRFYLLKEFNYDLVQKQNKADKFFEKIWQLHQDQIIDDVEFDNFMEYKDEQNHTLVKETEFVNSMQNFFDDIKIKNTIEHEYDKYLFEVLYAVPKKKLTKELKIGKEIMKNYSFITEPHKTSACDIYNYDKAIRQVLLHNDGPKILVLGSTPELRDLAYKYRLTNNASIICLGKNEQMHKKMNEYLTYENLQEMFLKIDWLNLPFEDNSIDLIIADFAGTIIENKKKEKFYSEIQRVLKDDAYFINREPVIIEEMFKDISVEKEFMKVLELVQKGEITIKQSFNWLAFNLICSSWFLSQDNQCSISFYEQELKRFDAKLKSVELIQNNLLQEIYKYFIEYWYSLKEQLYYIAPKNEIEKTLQKYFDIKDTLFSQDYSAADACPLYMLQPIQNYDKQLATGYSETGLEEADLISNREGSFAPTKPELEIYEKYLTESLQFNDSPEILVLGATPELRDLAIKHNCQTVAIDISNKILQKMNDLMEYKDSDKNIYLKGDWMAMDKFLRQDSFDIIMGDISFNYLDSVKQEQLLQVLKRLLKPGGKMIFRNIVIAENKPMTDLKELQQQYDNNQNNWLMFLMSVGMYTVFKKQVYNREQKELNFEKLFELFDDAINQAEIKLREEDVLKYENFKNYAKTFNFKIFLSKEFEESVGNNFMVINKQTSGWKFSDSAPIFLLGQM